MSQADLAAFLSIHGFPLSAMSMLNNSLRSLNGNTSTLNLTQYLLDHARGHDDIEDECWMDLLDMSTMYVVPVIIAVGLVGNLLACIVFLNTHLKMRSSSYYLAALAMADFGFLVSCLLVWLGEHVDVQMFNVDGWCQAVVYVTSVCSFLSVWLIVAFTVERYIAIQYPLHRPHMCTVRRAKTIVACLTGLSVLVHVYSFFTAGAVQVDGEITCALVEHYHDLMTIINIADCLLTLIIPLLLIIVMNTMITRNLVKFRKRFKTPECTETTTEQSKSNIELHKAQGSSSSGRKTPSNQGSHHSSSSNNSRNVRCNNSQNKIEMSVLTISRMQVRSSNSSLVSTRTQHSITKMLLLISTVFVLLNLPSYVIRLYIFIGYSLWSQVPPPNIWCLQQFAMLLYYTNFSINFLLYSMCGITFRRCLWQLLRKAYKNVTSFRCHKPKTCSSWLGCEKLSQVRGDNTNIK